MFSSLTRLLTFWVGGKWVAGGELEVLACRSTHTVIRAPTTVISGMGGMGGVRHQAKKPAVGVAVALQSMIHIRGAVMLRPLGHIPWY
jgi:hypothetical protein